MLTSSVHAAGFNVVPEWQLAFEQIESKEVPGISLQNLLPQVEDEIKAALEWDDLSVSKILLTETGSGNSLELEKRSACIT